MPDRETSPETTGPPSSEGRTRRRSRRRGTVGARGLIVLGLLAVLLPAAVGAWAISLVRTDLIEGVRAGHLTTALSIARSLESGVRLAESNAAAHRADLQSAVISGNANEQLRVLERIYTTTPLYSRVATHAASGTPIAAYPPGVTPAPLDDPAVAGRARRDGDDAVYRFRSVFAADTDNRTFTADISFAKIAPGIRELRVGETGSVTIVSRNGDVLLSGDARRVGRRLFRPSDEAWRDWTQRPVEFFGPNLKRAEIGALVPVNGRDWGVLVTQGRSEATAGVGTLTRTLLAGMILLLAVGGVSSYVIARVLGRNAARLREEIIEQQRLNKALHQFSGHVAHDLRNPLAAIDMASEVLSFEEERLSDRGRSALTIVQRQTESALRLIDDLLQFARASGTPNRKRVQVDEVVRTVADEVEGVDLKIEEAPREIEADPASLEQALSNLLQNAARYASSAGTAQVTFRCTESSDGWRLAVADRGPGLAPGDAARMFEPFVRGAATGEHGGTGLGLAIVSMVATGHGGRAWYESRAGGGSVFWMYLPRPSADRKVAAADESP